MNFSKNTVIIICGPTAVGKTSFAIDLATQLQTEIISADSRQCFKELNIGVAKPSAIELDAVKHYFINSHSIFDQVNAAVFEEYALHAAYKIFEKHKVAVMVGGTGLYMKAFCEGMDEIPEVDEAVRQQVYEMYEQNGLAHLQTQLALRDPEFWQQTEQQNTQRLMRALEVLLSTGQSITAFQKGRKEERPFNIIKIGLELPRQQLYNQINNRVDKMVEKGLVDEVKSLVEYQHLNALQTVGYREIFEYLNNEISFPSAINSIKTNTRHYAKRQLTWFKKDGEIKWFEAGKNDPFKFI